MLKPVYDFAKQLLNLARDTQKNSSDIKELQKQVEVLTDRVVRLSFDLERYRESDKQDREMQLLRLENALLRFERRLPAAPSTDDTAI
jgi:molecular chaperone GrpE (heat shock protein)